MLFPWNAFISANDYFKEKYKPFPIEFTLPLIYNYPNMIFLLIVSKWGDKWPLRGFVIIFFAFVLIVIRSLHVPKMLVTIVNANPSVNGR